MKIKVRNFVILLILASLLGAVLSIAVIEFKGDRGLGTIEIKNSEYKRLKYMDEKYSKLETMWQDISNNFYRDVKDEKLELGVYRGLFASLEDIYSGYMTKEEYESWIADTLGQFEGVGITFNQEKDGRFKVINVIKNGPAQKSGIKAGDYILKVDGKTYKDSENIGAAMRGKAGTEVEITYQRGDKTNTVKMTRSKIVVESVSSKVLDGNIGYIKISAFEEATADDFKAALKDMEVASVKGVVIDLRNNGGGLVTAGTDVADKLLGKGTITYLEDKNGKRKYIKSDSSRTDLPYVLLINKNTASTSEIVAAAIKDNGPGKIVGTQSFGKGVVQSTTQLSDGSATKLTIMQYFSPKGTAINKKGVTPDYKVEGDKAQLEKAIELLKK